MKLLSPIALFVYKRPNHTQRTIEALMQCLEFKDSELYIFSDAAKKKEDEKLVLETRNLVKSMVGEKAKIVEAEKNQGLAKSIISGVNSILESHDRIIVLEDDLVVSPCFLDYINTALETYQDEASVMQVSGYMYPIKELSQIKTTLFLPFISSWGWATWKRAWSLFDPNAQGWEVLKTDKQLRERFDLDGNYSSFYGMLKNQMSGEEGIDSWAIRWYWSVFKNSGLVVYPPVSFVYNIGNIGEGEHGSMSASFKLSKNVTLSTELFSFSDNLQISTNEYSCVKIYTNALVPRWRYYIRVILGGKNVRRLKKLFSG